MKERRVPPIGETIETCDRCGQNWETGQLRSQAGGKVCPRCYDDPDRTNSKPTLTRSETGYLNS